MIIPQINSAHGQGPACIYGGQQRGKGLRYRVDYEPGGSTSGLFGGNSNWRGPIWFPVNFTDRIAPELSSLLW
jgi:hypothetical protein